MPACTQVTARLESDAVAADNYRYCAIDLPADVPVLLVDGDARATDAKFLGFALAPGEPVRTGIRPQIETPRYLSAKPLADFQAISLANIDRLDDSAVESLEKYVAAGGGVAFFLGEHCDMKFFNDALYRGGKGLFPRRWRARRSWRSIGSSRRPTFSLASTLFSACSPPSRTRFFRLWRCSDILPFLRGGSRRTTRRSASRPGLRNGAPLVLERRFGKGRVMAFLTSAAPTWNNWAQNPSFVVAMQDLQAYLSQRSAAAASRLVGAPLELSLDPAAYQPPVRFALPEEAAAPPVTVQAVRGSDGLLTASFPDTDLSGFYEAQLTRANNAIETRRYAVNVEAAEGDLAVVSGEQLATRLEGVKYQFDYAAAFQSAAWRTCRVEPRRSHSLRIDPAADRRTDFGLVGQLPSGKGPRVGPRRPDMTHAFLPLWADAIRTTFEWGRIQSNSDWILPIAVCVAVSVLRPLDVSARRRGTRSGLGLAVDRPSDGHVPRVAGSVFAAALAFGAGGSAERPACCCWPTRV